MKNVEDKFKLIGIWGVPIMFVMLLIVVYQSSKVRATQLENTDIARAQRSLGISKEDTIIRKQDTIILLFKSIKKLP